MFSGAFNAIRHDTLLRHRTAALDPRVSASM